MHNDQEDTQKCTIEIKDLPVEVFLHICSFLDECTLIHSLSLTCKQFHQILNDDSIWRARIRQTWPNVTYPISPHVDDDNFFWKRSCITVQKRKKLWMKTDVRKIHLENVHYSTIDGLLLMHKGETCVSGGRDRSLAISRLPNEERLQCESTIQSNAHKGWIWGLTSIEDTIFSCSWDGKVKSWAIVETGLRCLTTYAPIQTGALLCIASCSDLRYFATGSFCQKVFVYDPRNGDEPIFKYKPHKRSVIRVSMNLNYIISASEDRTVSIWDQRAGKTLQNNEVSKDSFIMSMCMQNNVVYVGDNLANIHVLDEKKMFEPVKTYKTEHKKSITGIHVDAGCLITSSLDRTVKISSPTDPPTLLSEFEFKNGEIASIGFLNETLAISGTDDIEIWQLAYKSKC
ncbi:hypothetical protein TKK_0011989 [Trichogramma kaykai]|uniref:F-box domain-containing protein n=1 Tax=Trichogramma kaykai TaxID=54128 RepID=A0ABD2WQS1_9HYME